MPTVVFINKWLHLLSVIGMLGAVICAAVVLVPAAAAATDGGAALRPLWRRFGILLGVSWLVVLSTGVLNLYFVSPSVNAGYQAILGTKILLAGIMFGLSLLAGYRTARGGRAGGRTGTWLLVTAVIGVAVVGMSARLNLSRISGAGLRSIPAPAAPRGS
jgi:hypothetical protein